MSHRVLIRAPKRRKRAECRDTGPTSASSLQDHLHPVPQLQRILGNQRVMQLIRNRRQGIGSLRMVQRDNRDTATRFDKRDRVAAQIMIGVVRVRQTTPPDLESLSTKLRPEHKEWILELWSAASGQRPGGGSTLTVPERHEALASGMRGALHLADRYALEEPSTGKTMRVELHDALQTLRGDLYAAGSKPASFSGALGFRIGPEILELGRERKLAKTGSPLSDQPAELRELVYLSFPSRGMPKEPEKWFADLTDRQRAAFTGLYNALSAKDLWRFAHTIHDLDNGEPHFWGQEQEGNTVSLKVVGDTGGLNRRLGDPEAQREVALDSPFMAMMHKGQKSYRELTSGPGLHISVGPGKHWDVHIDAHPPVKGQGKESEAELANRFLLHGLQELFPNMPRALLIGLLKKVKVPPHIAKKIGNQVLPAVRFHPATNSPLWQTDNPTLIDSLEIEALEQDGKQMTATVGISRRF